MKAGTSSDAVKRATPTSQVQKSRRKPASGGSPRRGTIAVLPEFSSPSRADEQAAPEPRVTHRARRHVVVQAANKSPIGRLSLTLMQALSLCCTQLKEKNQKLRAARHGRSLPRILAQTHNLIPTVAGLTGQILAMRVIALESFAAMAAQNFWHTRLGVGPGEVLVQSGAQSITTITENTTTPAANTTPHEVTTDNAVGKPLRRPALSGPWTRAGLVPTLLSKRWGREGAALLIQVGTRIESENQVHVLYERPPVPYYKIHEEISDRPLPQTIRRLITLGLRVENAKITCALARCAATGWLLQRDFDLVMEKVHKQGKHAALRGAFPRTERQVIESTRKPHKSGLEKNQSTHLSAAIPT